MPQPLIHITRRHALIFAFFLVLYEFLTYIANDMIMPGMLKVVESFHGHESNIATSLTAYMLGGASLQLILGPLSDRYGRRPVMLFGAFLFVICTAGIGSSQSMSQFMAGRFFQGMGLCFISVIGYATLQEIFEEMDAIRLISIMANVALVAPLLGPLLGAIIIQSFSWRYIFVVIGIFAVVSFFGLKRYMPETVGVVKRNGETIGRMSISLENIAFNYFKLLKNRSFMMGSIAIGFVYTPCLVWIALAPVILIKETHLSFFQYGLWQIPVFGACILGNVCLHRMTHHVTLNRLISIGSWFAISGLIMMLVFTAFLGNNYLAIMPGVMIYFFGLGFVNAPLNRWTLFTTSVMKGTASALMSMVSMGMMALELEFSNWVYSGHSQLLLSLYCFVLGCAYLIALWNKEVEK